MNKNRHIIGKLQEFFANNDADYSSSAPEFIKVLQKSKSVKYSRSIGYYTTTISAKYSDIKVNLFFYREGKNGN